MDTKASWILWLKIFGVLALLLAVFAYMTTVTVIFVPFLCAVVLNVMLSPIVSARARRDYKRETAVMFVFLAFAAVMTVAVLVLPDYVVKEAELIKGKWPEAKLKLEALLLDAQNFVNVRVPAENQVDFVNDLPAKGKHYVEMLVSGLPHLVAEGTIAILLIPLFTFFLLRDGRSFKKGLVAAVPNRYFEMTLSLIYRVNQQVGNYLRGLTMEATADTIVCTLLCLAFGLPNPLIIGIIAGATTVAPVAGMVISIAICPLVALFSATGDPLTVVLLVGLAIVITHIIDNVVIAPMIMGHSVHMHPAAVIVSIIVAGKLFGVLGIVLAVPTVSVLRVLIQEGYRGIKSNEYYLKSA
jgi:putative permease